MRVSKKIIIFLLWTTSINFAYSAPLKWHVTKSASHLTFKTKLTSADSLYDQDTIHLTYNCYSNDLKTPVRELSFDSVVNEVSLSENLNLRHRINSYGEWSIEDQEFITKLIKSSKIHIFNQFSDRYLALSLQTILPAIITYKNEIKECAKKRKSDYEADIAEKDSRKRKEMIIIGASILASFFSLFITIKLFRKLWKKLRTITFSKKFTSFLTIKKNIKKQEKITETAIDEVVRQLVRQATNDGINPNDIKICSSCSGSGCIHCNEKGWKADK